MTDEGHGYFRVSTNLSREQVQHMISLCEKAVEKARSPKSKARLQRNLDALRWLATVAKDA